jgi:hypothetical protein
VILLSPASVAQLIRPFDRHPNSGGSGDACCHAGDLSAIVAMLSYPYGRSVTTRVGVTSRGGVTNGAITRAGAAPQAQKLVRRLFKTKL